VADSRGKKGSSGLSVHQRMEQLALARLHARSLMEAAAAANIHYMTAIKYSKDPEYRALEAKVRADCWNEAINRMAGQLTHGLETLHSVMDGNADSARVNAARIIIEMVSQAVTLDGLRKEVSDLRAQIEAQTASEASTEEMP